MEEIRNRFTYKGQNDNISTTCMCGEDEGNRLQVYVHPNLRGVSTLECRCTYTTTPNAHTRARPEEIFAVHFLCFRLENRIMKTVFPQENRHALTVEVIFFLLSLFCILHSKTRTASSSSSSFYSVYTSTPRHRWPPLPLDQHTDIFLKRIFSSSRKRHQKSTRTTLSEENTFTLKQKLKPRY